MLTRALMSVPNGPNPLRLVYTRPLPTPWVKLLVSLLIGLLAGAAGGYLLAAHSLERAKAAELVAVPVAKKEIRQGTYVDNGKAEEFFEMRGIAKTKLPVDAIRDPRMIEGHVLNRTIAAGSFCVPFDLTQPFELGRSLPDRTLAVTVRVHKDHAHRLLPPGSRVDVLGHLPVPGEPGATVSKVILQDIAVLATGGEPDPNFVTLAVTPGDAEKLAWAARTGPIMLAVRKPRDDHIIKTQGFQPPSDD